ncbi:MAG: magnesium transporter [Candidatus Bathyarchaeia archaeon]
MSWKWKVEMMKGPIKAEANLANSGGVKPNGRFSLFTQSTLSLSSGVGGLIAGGLLEHYLGLILFRNWVIAVYPIVLTTKGALNGVLAGRLSTGLHVELIKPSFRGNTRYYYAIVSSLAALSIVISLILSVMALLLTGSPIDELPLMVAICISTQAVASLLTIPITSAVGFFAFKKGLDPDATLYPVSSTIADIWATISYIMVLSSVFSLPNGALMAYLIASAMVITTTIFAFAFRDEAEYWRTIKEASLTMVAVTLISTVSGYALSSIRSQIEESPGILLVYPALIDTLGDIVAIFGSASTTKLFLGAIESKLSQILVQIRDLIQLWLSAIIYFTLYGLIAYISSGNISRFFIPLISFHIVFPIMIVIASVVAILTFKKGLDPDNFVIPIETALTDMAMTVCVALLAVAM